MSKTAFIFPGQGAQYIGMGKDFYEWFPDSRDIYDRASALLGIDMTKLCFEENDNLNITEYTQIAMVTTCMAILLQIRKMGLQADVCAGLSLGEYPAMMACDVMSFEDGIQVVRKRGILMQQAVKPGIGAMAAVLGMDTDIIEKVCEDTEGIVSIANYNCPGQVVISGEKNAVEAAGDALKQKGAKKIIPLNVSGPFHSLMLREAGEKLYDILQKVNVGDPKSPYVANVNAQVVYKKDGIREILAKQVYSSVMWQQSVENMIASGVDTFVEIGPGKTLSAFVKKIDRTCNVINIDKVEDLKKVTELVNHIDLEGN